MAATNNNTCNCRAGWLVPRRLKASGGAAAAKRPESPFAATPKPGAGPRCHPQHPGGRWTPRHLSSRQYHLPRSRCHAWRHDVIFLPPGTHLTRRPTYATRLPTSGATDVISG